LHFIEIKFETLQSENEDVWEGFNADSFCCFDFFIAFLAVVGILALKDLLFDELL
jgi:hypothetical protein